MQQRQYIHAIQVQYRGLGNELVISMDGNSLGKIYLPDQDLQRRRVTLPVCLFGTFPQYQFNTIEPDNLLEFERVAEKAYQQQQLFHYFDVGIRGQVSMQVYVDNLLQSQAFTFKGTQDPTNIKIYFDEIAYGYIPHLHNTGSGEVLWANPVALPPRYYRGRRTHAEFQITYSGNVELQWYLDGELVSDPYEFLSSKTITEKRYFPTGTVGHVLQYRHLNPQEGGKVFMVETDQTLADLEQQAMQPQQ